MFDKQTLDKLRGVMNEVVQEEIFSFMEHQILPQFERIYSKLESMGNWYATKDLKA